jgi:Acetyltransferase (GNAT) domain
MEIRVIDDVMTNQEIGTDLGRLVHNELANEQSLDATLRQIGYDEGGTLIVGGFVDGRLATMNAFMHQSFVRAGETFTGYQSGFSATGSEHRGKGYWPKLLTASMEIVRGAGGHFIYGFPNPVSHPLFVKKLGFATAPMWKSLLPAVATNFIRFPVRQTDSFFRADLGELADWKMAAVAGGVIRAAGDTYFAFGKARMSKGVRYIDIGGMSSGDGRLNLPIRHLCKAARASMFRFEASQSSEFSGGFPAKRPSRPVIFKALDGPLTIDDVSFTGGLADSY